MMAPSFAELIDEDRYRGIHDQLGFDLDQTYDLPTYVKVKNYPLPAFPTRREV